MAEFEPQDRIVTVFGGSGFIGRHLVRALANEGWRVRVATRRPDLAFHLQPLGRVGQIHAVQANIRYPESLSAALRGASAAVNLVGILQNWGKQSFNAVQAEGAGAVARAARDAGVENFIHVSAIGANPASGSDYARSKAEGEYLVRDALPGAKILRPSVVFGPEDQFFNRFAAMARLLPVMPAIGGGVTKLQPVYVGDVAKAAALLLRGGGVAGATYELGGPAIKTLRESIDFTLETIFRAKPVVDLPFGPAGLIGGAVEAVNKALLGLLPAELVFTPDQVELLKSDNLVSDAAKSAGLTLQGLGIAPESVETIVPTYLYRYRPTGQYADQRAV